MKRKSFFLGGSSAYPFYASEFITAAGGKDARIAVLVQSLTGWQRYGDEISEPWLEHGVSHISPVFPNKDGLLDIQKTILILRQATGIFIGGGNTPTYYQLFALRQFGSSSWRDTRWVFLWPAYPQVH
jgi:cyanophycinase